MPSVWERRHGTTGVRFRVEYRVGGRESRSRYAGSFTTKREALIRKAWVAGELAAMRVPDLTGLAEPAAAATVSNAAARWQASRVDVAEGTAHTYRVALGRILPKIGDVPLDAVSVATITDLIAGLGSLKRESLRKTLSVLAMILDHEGIQPNPARDARVKLPRGEKRHIQPPTAAHVDAVYRLLPTAYRLPLLVLDATGMRVGELEALTRG